MSASDVLIDVQHLSKVYCRDLKRALWYAVGDIARELTATSRSRKPSISSETGGTQDPVLRPGEFWALRDVSFQLRRGECFGLVGGNGAGKSTILKVLNGLIRPDSGSVTVRGRMGALIELGAGFNPVLSGRENIYVNAAVLGLRSDEVRKKLDSIVDFAELESFIDAPLQSYSSGMRVRLGFAVAAHVDPDILLVDEVLAVGDAAFRQKCSRRLAELAKRGTAFILVTHSAHTQLTLCQQGLYLRSGCVRAVGPIQDVMRAYEQEQAPQASGLDGDPKLVRGARGLMSAEFARVDGSSPLTSGEPCQLTVRITSDQWHKDVDLALIIRGSQQGASLIEMSTRRDAVRLSLEPGSQEVSLLLPYLCLLPGTYTMKLGLTSDTGERLDYVEGMTFRVTSTVPASGNEFFQPRSWHLRQLPAGRATEVTPSTRLIAENG